VAEQNSPISSALPGSCPANWLQGTPSTVKPRSAKRFCSRSVTSLGRIAKTAVSRPGNRGSSLPSVPATAKVTTDTTAIDRLRYLLYVIAL